MSSRTARSSAPGARAGGKAVARAPARATSKPVVAGPPARAAGAKAAANGAPGQATRPGAAAQAAASVQTTPQQKLAAAQSLMRESERRLEGVNEEIHATALRLAQVKTTESFDANTGIGVNLSGQSIAHLEVNVMSARDLPKMDMFSGKADPYVIVKLNPQSACPDTSEKKTETKWKNLAPSWNAQFDFSPILTRDATLNLTLMDAEKFGEDDFMAQVDIPLESLLSQEYEEAWYDLADPEGLSGAEVVKGQLRVRTKFTFSQIVPLEARLTELHQTKANVEQELAALQEQINRLSAKKSIFRKAAPAAAPAVDGIVAESRDRRASSAADRAAMWLMGEPEGELPPETDQSPAAQKLRRQSEAQRKEEEMEDTDLCVIQ